MSLAARRLLKAAFLLAIALATWIFLFVAPCTNDGGTWLWLEHRCVGARR